MSGYRTQSEDTDPAAEAVQIEIFRRMTPAQKYALVLSLNRRARSFQMAGIRARHPEADSHELKMRLFSLWLDRETMIKVYDWDPEVHGLG
jgi:hypothetical protein